MALTRHLQHVDLSLDANVGGGGNYFGSAIAGTGLTIKGQSVWSLSRLDLWHTDPTQWYSGIVSQNITRFMFGGTNDPDNFQNSIVEINEGFVDKVGGGPKNFRHPLVYDFPKGTILQQPFVMGLIYSVNEVDQTSGVWVMRLYYTRLDISDSDKYFVGSWAF